MDEKSSQDSALKIIGESLLVMIVAIAAAQTPWLKAYRHDIIAGAILLVLGRVIPPVLRQVLQRRPAPKWLVSMALIAGGISGYLVATFRAPTPHTILFISPVQYVSRQGFYGRVVDELIHQGSDNGLDLTVWLPNEDFEVQAQKALLDRAVQEKADFAAIVFTPFKTYSQDDANDLFQFFSNMGSANLILFDSDLPNSLRDRLAKNGLDIPPCVKGDEAQGGRLAAQALLNFFNAQHMRRATVADIDQVVPKERSRSLDAALKEGANGMEITILPWITRDFTRAEARQITLSELTGGTRVDAIFSGNDVSALGARDAIIQMRDEKVPAAEGDIKIMGYDAIDDVIKVLQQRDDTLILNTVDVDIPDQATAIVRFAKALQANRASVVRQSGDPCFEVEPRLLR